MVEPLALILCVKEVVGQAVGSAVDVGDTKEEGDAEFVCVMVSLNEPKEAETEAL